MLQLTWFVFQKRLISTYYCFDKQIFQEHAVLTLNITLLHVCAISSIRMCVYAHAIVIYSGFIYG